MGSFSIWHWLIVLIVVVLVFGTGKLPKAMGDLAEGIKRFKAGMKDGTDDASATAEVKPLPNATATVDPTVKKDETARG